MVCTHVTYRWFGRDLIFIVTPPLLYVCDPKNYLIIVRVFTPFSRLKKKLPNDFVTIKLLLQIIITNSSTNYSTRWLCVYLSPSVLVVIERAASILALQSHRCVCQKQEKKSFLIFFLFVSPVEKVLFRSSFQVSNNCESSSVNYQDIVMSQHEQAFTAAVNIIRSMPKDGKNHSTTQIKTHILEYI